VSTPWQHVAARTERVVVGPGTLSRLPGLCDELGMTRVVVVTGRTLRERTPLPAAVEALLRDRHAATFAGIREHVPASVRDELVGLLRERGADGVVSLGGGSPIDGAKAAIHARDGGATPHIAVPTTLSAAEFTPTAGITDDATAVKGGVAAPGLTPRTVVLDAEVTVHTPERLWLSTGIRALDHAVETVYAPEGDRFAEVLALEAIRRLRVWLPRSQADPAELEARQQLQVAAWWSILGLPSVTVAPSHPLGRLLGPLGGIGHGITSCVLLPAAIEWTASRHPERVLPLCAAFGVAAPAEVGAACRALIAGLGLPVSLAEAGLDEAAIARVRERVPPEWAPVLEASR